MGERLVVEIRKSNKILASIYYHWSAYSKPSVEIAATLNKHVLSRAHAFNDDELVLAIIRFAENTTGLGYMETAEIKDQIFSQFTKGLRENSPLLEELISEVFLSNGGVHPRDLQEAKRRYPNETFSEMTVSRNEGLVAISENTIHGMLTSTNGYISIDLDEETALNSLFYAYTPEEYMEATEDVSEEDFVYPQDLPVLSIDPRKCRLNQLDELLEELKKLKCSWAKYGDIIFELHQ